MGVFDDLVEKPQAEANVFSDLKNEKNMFSDLSQKDTDESFLKSATAGIKLVWKLNAQAGMPVLKNAVDFYNRTHSAIIAGVGNITNAAQGTEPFQPIEAAAAGFQSEERIPASVITQPIMDKLASVTPDIQVSEQTQNVVNAGIQNATPLGLAEQGYNAINSAVHGGEIPSQPLDVTPELGASVAPGLKALPSQAAEVAVDMMTDPILNSLKLYPLVGKGVSAVAKVTGLNEVVSNAVKNAVKLLPTNMVDKLARFFTVRGGRDADFVNLLDKYYEADQRALSMSNDLAKAMSEGLDQTQRTMLGNSIRNLPKFTEAESTATIGKTLEGGVTGELTRTSEAFQVAQDMESKAKVIRDMFVNLGAEGVREGFMTSETFMKHAGDFFPAYRKDKELEAMARKFGLVFNKTPNIKGGHFLQRKDLTWEEREAKGYIMDPAYPVSRYIQQVAHDFNAHTLLKSVGQNEAWVSNEAKEGFEYITAATGQGKSTVYKWGSLAGKYLRKDVYDDLHVVVKIPGDLEKTYLTAMKVWKLSRVIPNPATWVNNIVGNVIMTDFAGTASWATMVPKLARAGKEMSGGKYLKELTDSGAWAGDYLTVERNLVENTLDPLKHSAIDLVTNVPNHFLKTIAESGIEAAKGVWEGMSKFYTSQDNAFKMAHYIHAREKLGLEIPQAVEYMRKWGFDFSKVSPALQFARNYLSPFATYTAKALPNVAEVILNNPAKFYKYNALFDAFNRMSARVHGLDESQLQTINKGTKGRPLILPWQDSEGNPLITNLQGMLPWGDMDSASTGLGLPKAASLSNPLFTLPAQMISNRNFFTQMDIMTDKTAQGEIRFSAENVKNMTKVIYQTLMPSLAPGGANMDEILKSISPTQEHRKTAQGLPKDAKLVILGALGGIRMRGIDVNKTMVRQSKALQSWIQDRKGRIRKFAKDESLTQAERDAKINAEIKYLTESVLEEVSDR